MRPNLCNKVLGGCRLEVLLGRGGMGDVYKAHHLNLDIPVAVKILDSELASSSGFIERFIMEARAAARLDSPYIVRVIQVGEEKGIYFIQMEFVEGESLGQKLKREASGLDIGLTLQLSYQIASGLMTAHQSNIIHRDVKPENILLNNKGQAKITDFGLAKCMQIASHLTSSGQILGTPYYLSPEQCMGKDSDARSDIYSLGISVYYMLTGKLPFQGENPMSVALSRLHTDPTLPTTLRHDIPKDVEALTMKMMARFPEDRYPDAIALIKDIVKLLQQYGQPSEGQDSTIAPFLTILRVPAQENEKPTALAIPTETCVLPKAKPKPESSRRKTLPLPEPEKEETEENLPKTLSDIQQLEEAEQKALAASWEEDKNSATEEEDAKAEAKQKALAASWEEYKNSPAEEEEWEVIATSQPGQAKGKTAAKQKNITTDSSHRMREFKSKLTGHLKAVWQKLPKKPTLPKLKSLLTKGVCACREQVKAYGCNLHLQKAEKMRQEGHVVAAIAYLKENIPPTKWCRAVEEKVKSLQSQSADMENRVVKLLHQCEKEISETILQKILEDWENSLPILLELLRTHKGWRLRATAAAVLGRCGDKAERAIPMLSGMLKEDNPLVSAAAAEALGRIGAAAAIPELALKLKAWDWRVRLAAAKALSRIAAPALPALQEALKSRVGLVRESAAYALGEMGDEASDAIPALIQTLKDKVWWVRKSAAEALGKMGPAALPAVPILTQVLQDEDWRIRRSIETVLKKIKHE